MGIRIGIGSLKIGQGSTGVDWSSYWVTRKPSALIVTGMRDTEIDFSWTDNSAGDCTFSIYRSTDGVNYSSVGTTVAGDTTYTATGLTAGTLYYFYVVGVKSSNESDPTNIYDTRFKITVDTTKAGSANDTFILPNYTSGTYNYYVDWGDGGAEENITTAGNHTHEYAASGTYQIKIRGVMPRIYFNNAGDRLKLMSIDNWGNIKWAAVQDYSYYRCFNVNGAYIDVPNWSSVTSIVSFLHDCYLFNWPMPFYTGKITNMSSALRNNKVFNQPLPWNTENVTIMTSLLDGALVFNQPLNFNTAKVTSMNNMFYLAYKFNQDVSGWNYEAITGTGLNDFISSTTSVDFSTVNYDLLLIALAAQDVNDTVTMAVRTTYTPGGAAAAARTHLTDVHSWTINDLGPSFSNGLLVLNFDDGGASQYVAYQDLVTQGEKATFYIISSIIGTESNLSWAQLQTMHAAGMDIQCHTYDHPHLTTLSEAQVYAEYDDLDAQFAANSLPAANHTSYPFGETSENVLTWTATRRLTGRCVLAGFVIPGSDKMFLRTYCMAAGTNFDTLKAAMLLAQNNKWAIMAYGHGIDGAQIPRDKFNEVIDYAQEIGMSIVTVSEMYALMT